MFCWRSSRRRGPRFRSASRSRASARPVRRARTARRSESSRSRRKRSSRSRSRLGRRPQRRSVRRRHRPADGDGRVKASPVARRMARELNVQLDQVQGSGPGGRIVKADVEAAAGSTQAQPAPAAAPRGERAPALRDCEGRRAADRADAHPVHDRPSHGGVQGDDPALLPVDGDRHDRGGQAPGAAEGDRGGGPGGPDLQRHGRERRALGRCATFHAPTAPTATGGWSCTRA